MVEPDRDGPAFSVEPARMEDLETIVDQWVALASDQRRHGSSLLAEENREQLRLLLAQHVVDDSALVAREGDDVLGFLNFELEDSGFERDTVRGRIQNVYVDPGSRGEGIGTALIGAAETAMAKRGAEVVTVEAMAANADARRLYGRLGYDAHRVVFSKPIGSDTHSNPGG